MNKYKSKRIKYYKYWVQTRAKCTEDGYNIHYDKEFDTKTEALRYSRKTMLKIKREVLSKHKDVFVESNITQNLNHDWVSYSYHFYAKQVI